jgi:hypothetical protein
LEGRYEATLMTGWVIFDRIGLSASCPLSPRSRPNCGHPGSAASCPKGDIYGRAALLFVRLAHDRRFIGAVLFVCPLRQGRGGGIILRMVVKTLQSMLAEVPLAICRLMALLLGCYLLQRRETIAVPAIPSTRAAPVDKSMQRPFTNGPRSFIRTVTLRPVECEVTVI